MRGTSDLSRAVYQTPARYWYYIQESDTMITMTRAEMVNEHPLIPLVEMGHSVLGTEKEGRELLIWARVRHKSSRPRIPLAWYNYGITNYGGG